MAYTKLTAWGQTDVGEARLHYLSNEHATSVAPVGPSIKKVSLAQALSPPVGPSIRKVWLAPPVGPSIKKVSLAQALSHSLVR